MGLIPFSLFQSRGEHDDALSLAILVTGFLVSPAAVWGSHGQLPFRPTPANNVSTTDATAGKVRDILKNHCHRCHGQDGANEGGFNYVTDLRRLVERKKVLPGEPGKSRLIKRILNPDDPMPPAEEKVRPSPEEIALLKQWIAAGAKPAEPPSHRPANASDVGRRPQGHPGGSGKGPCA